MYINFKIIDAIVDISFVSNFQLRYTKKKQSYEQFILNICNRSIVIIIYEENKKIYNVHVAYNLKHLLSKKHNILSRRSDCTVLVFLSVYLTPFTHAQCYSVIKI